MTDQEITIDINTNVKTGGKVVFVSGIVLANELNNYIEDHIEELQAALNSMKKMRGPDVDNS
jgi:hypothetical protein